MSVLVCAKFGEDETIIVKVMSCQTFPENQVHTRQISKGGGRWLVQRYPDYFMNKNTMKRDTTRRHCTCHKRPET